MENNLQYTLFAPERLDCVIDLPASKSISNRAIIINALLTGRQPGDELQNLSDCDDTEVVVKALTEMPEVIDIGAAGTAMRFLTAYLSTRDGETHILTGSDRMKQRPIGVLVDALRRLGAQIEYVEQEGYPPLRITGCQLEGGTIEMKGDVSSQFISALLLIGPMLKRGLQLVLTDRIISRPYIDLTIHTMHDFGGRVEWTDVNTITAEPEGYQLRNYLIENDWSASSYWYEILALMKEREHRLQLTGLANASRQGDSVVRYMFTMLGVRTVFASSEQGVPTMVCLKKTPLMPPRLDYDFIDQPDLAQTLVVSCALLNIPFRFTGLGSLRIKETDRIDALKREMLKLGYILVDEESALCWNGDRCEPTLEPIDTYEDHRMAMAFAPACICFPGLRINNPQVVSKSYPKFWDDLRAAGFTIE
ncbi:MAG: 3-phosphoshikimate 1-carboxyvinyltransferase [Prevotella sp.]|nr:3-phosphoshikimate 1-carboxyvinyltransferase [Prevotella sp.]